MLEPRDRMLLFDALRPPVGFRFDEGIGTSYTLDLLAMLMAPLAFTMFSDIDDGPNRAVNSLEILESLRRYAEQLTLFCHAGRIAPPRTSYPQLAFIERSIVECQALNGGAFHPKVWVLRWTGDAGEVRYRVLCLSRNLTFSRAWDSLLALDGIYIPNRRSTVGRNAGLVEFVRALPGFVTRKPLDPVVVQRVERLASELERTEFEVPSGFDDALKFWPLGLPGKQPEPLRDLGNRLLVVSPFLTVGRLNDIAEGCRDVSLVSTSTALNTLARKPDGITRYYTLAERAVMDRDLDASDDDAGLAEPLELSDLHAKLYVTEHGATARMWTGSANATSAAFGGNVEFLVELSGPRKLFGIDTLMEQQRGELRFIDLLEDAAEAVASDPVNPEIEALEKQLETLREQIAGTSMTAHVAERAPGIFDLTLTKDTEPELTIPEGISAKCWPVTLTPAAVCEVATLSPAEPFATFASATFQAITAFYTFEVKGRAAGEDRAVLFTVNLPLVGAPEGRRERVLRDAVSDRSKMMRFLLLLLADEGVPVPGLDSGSKNDADSEKTLARLLEGGLFEMLLKNLDRSPERLDNLSALLKELRVSADGTDLLPDQFDAIWTPIWQLREARRAGVGV